MSSMRQDDRQVAHAPAPTGLADHQPSADVGRFARYLAQATARIGPGYLQFADQAAPHTYRYELYHQLRTVIDASRGLECIDFPYQLQAAGAPEPPAQRPPDFLIGAHGPSPQPLIALVTAPLTTPPDQLARDLALLSAWTNWTRDERAARPCTRAIYLLYGAAGRSIATIRSWAARLTREHSPAADLARIDLYWHRRGGTSASRLGWTPASSPIANDAQLPNRRAHH